MYKLNKLLAAVTAAVAVATLSPASAAQEAQAVRNVVLVHGLFADGSSWAKVIPLLQNAGLQVTAVQNSLTSFEEDVKATERAIAMQDGPVVLVGHSYGGMVITQTGNDPKVKGLVYVAARAPEANEDYAALLKRFPAAPATAGTVWSSDGFGQLSESAFVHDFAGDLPEQEALVYYAVQGRVARDTPTARNTVAAWHDKPSWYAVSRQDRTANPELERFMAGRIKATTIELDSSHVSMLSHPREVADLIIAATKGSAARQ